jgi:hypothetical protein
MPGSRHFPVGQPSDAGNCSANSLHNEKTLRVLRETHSNLLDVGIDATVADHLKVVIVGSLGAILNVPEGAFTVRGISFGRMATSVHGHGGSLLTWRSTICCATGRNKAFSPSLREYRSLIL